MTQVIKVIPLLIRALLLCKAATALARIKQRSKHKIALQALWLPSTHHGLCRVGWRLFSNSFQEHAGDNSRLCPTGSHRTSIANTSYSIFAYLY
jgi:hypothetical protein